MLSTETSDQAGQTSLEIPVDSEHGRMRFAILLTFVGTLVISYIVVSILMPMDSLNLIAIGAAFVIAAIFTQIVERYMKEKWPSGRVLDLSADKIQLVKNGQSEVAIDPHKQVNVLQWRFTIKRRSRVKKGWYVVSCALEQDQLYIPAYTFLSPDEFDAMPWSDQFVRLMDKKELGSGGNERDMRLAGQQRRLHNAENQRWLMGAEMSPEAFQQYMHYLETNYSKWMSA